MKKLFSLFLLSAMTGASGQTLLTNGGFEQDDASWIYYQEVPNGAKGTFSVVTADPYAGSKCAQIIMTAPGKNIWDAQISQCGYSVSQGTMYTLTFYARATGGATNIQAGFVKNSEPYTWHGGQIFPVTSSWKKYELVFASPVTTASDIQVVLQFAKTTGTYFFDDVALEKSGSMTPVPDDWYQKADERIEQIRKGDFSIKIVKGSATVPSCSVKVELKNGEFKWGTCLTLGPGMNSTEEWYRTTAAKYFNYGVFENAFKWQPMEPSQGSVQYSDVDRYLRWADSLGWELRGHALVWGGDRWLPAWVKSLSANDKISAVKTRISRDVKHYKGKIAEYDVVNEPIHETYLADQTGDSINTLAFKWAREADPAARLYINDYNIIAGADGFQYRSLIEKMIKDKAPIDGIGVQGHFQVRVDWKLVASRLNYIAELGLPIKVTEFDMDVNKIGMTQQEMAEDFSKIMRIAFSHPAVNAFLFWGFWDGRHWINGAGMFDAGQNKKIAADSVYHLIHTAWTTKKDAKAGAGGECSFRGFYGTYDVRVNVDGSWKNYSVNFRKGGSKSVQIDVASGIVGVSDLSGGAVSAHQISAEPAGTGLVRICDIRGRIVAAVPVGEYRKAFGCGTLQLSAGALKLSPGTYFVLAGERNAIRVRLVLAD